MSAKNVPFAAKATANLPIWANFVNFLDARTRCDYSTCFAAEPDSHGLEIEKNCQIPLIAHGKILQIL